MTNKIVFITGCSTGIGRALACACVNQGDTVIATARRPETLADIAGERLIPMALDVNDQSAIEAVINDVKERFGRIDLLINNAGFAAMGPVTELTTEAMQAQFATNVFAPVAVTREALPLLEASDHAQVVNVGSVSGILTTPFSGAYCATKAALHSLSDAMRMELAPFGIDVIVVQPGAIQSSFGDNSLSGVEHLLDASSRYKPLEKQIRERAVASQQNPTTAGEFAASLLSQLATNPAPVIRIGNGSRILPMMQRWLPARLRYRILSAKFGLKSLSK